MMTAWQALTCISNKRNTIPALLLLLLTLFAVQPAAAQTFIELYPFNSTGNLSDGGWPEAAVVRDAAGNLYGTTFYGGGGTGCSIIYNGCGVVFKLDPSGTETVLHSFSGAQDGYNPTASLILDAAGDLYGTTPLGGVHGFGVVFKLDSAGNETVLHTFEGISGNDGSNPNAGLVQDTSGHFYGTTQYGGRGDYGRGNGTVFEVTASGQETLLYRFKGGLDGASPFGSVVVDPSGNVYGTTWVGGLYGYGTVFRVDRSGNEKVLHSFAAGSDGANPLGGLALDAAGNLFGTTSAGGTHGFGTIFTVEVAGNGRILYSFTGGNDGAYPYSNLILDASGNLDGTASQGGALGGGTVFEFSQGTLITLHSFSAAPNGTNPDGQNPMGGLAADSAGNLYGTAVQAGTDGWGSVFEIQLDGQSLASPSTE
jgi:uncharacterized repeat protein (TIGR03803 family)